MSDSDSFIEEVSEEVRRDRLYGLLRRYGWIPALAVIALVGGAAWTEYQKAQDRAQAQRLGDAMLAALEQDTPEARATALSGIEAETSGGAAVLALLGAAAQAESDAADIQTRQRLEAIASDGELPEIYRAIAGFKALLSGADTLEPAQRRAGFEGLAQPGNPLRLLAEEQLALIEIEAGDTDAALARLGRIIEDAEVTSALRNRASQLIVALGGTPQAT